MKKLIISTAVMAALGAGVSTSANAVLVNGSKLNFDPGVVTTAYGVDFVKSGSYFGMDTSGDGAITANERTAIQQNMGLLLSLTQFQPASGSHGGAPGCVPTGLTGDTCTNSVPNGEHPGIDKAWSFFGNTGMHYTSSPAAVLSASGATATVDFSGWGVTWNGIPAINMGSGAWAGNANGIADVTCGVDCAAATHDTYTLDYSATVPIGDPSGFGGVKYDLHLVGTVSAVPVPTAVWLFGSGLLGLAGVARRKKTA